MNAFVTYPPQQNTSSFSVFETPSFYFCRERLSDIPINHIVDISKIDDIHLSLYTYLNTATAFQIYYDPSDIQESVGINIFGQDINVNLINTLIPSKYRESSLVTHELKYQMDHALSISFDSTRDAVDFYNAILSIHQRVYK